MTSAELDGKHEHQTEDGQKVQIWFRDGRYLARARWNGQQIGITLGEDPESAGHALRRLVTAMEDGTFVPAQQARRQRFRTGPVPKLSLRQLANAFLIDRRKLKGKQTARDCGNRLAHVLVFAELPGSRRKWPLAGSLNHDFAVELRNFLFQRQVTRNGKDGGKSKRMSPIMVRLCLEALRAMLNWASRPAVNLLPSPFGNPITEEIMGPKVVKDPHRKNPLPMTDRIRLVEQMDAWQLLHLTASLILPLRFEDISGAVISDFDWDERSWHLGTRLQGNDFNKGRCDLRMPLPQELIDLWRATVGERADGPMFRTRADWSGTKRRRLRFDSAEEFGGLCQTAIQNAPADDVATEQDRKLVVRQLLAKCGAVPTDTISRELRQLLNAAGLGQGIRPYDVRAAVTTDMHHAGVRHLEMRYITEHTIKDILNEYTGLDSAGEMEKYFQHITPLLTTVRQRAEELRILTASNSDLANRI